MNVVNRFLGLKKNNRNAYFFFTVMCVFLVMFLISCIVNTCVNGKLFFVSEKLFFPNIKDWFMDFFNVNYFVVDMDPYVAKGSSYPPLALLLAKLFSLCTNYSISPKFARETTGGIISLMVFFLIFFVTALILLRKVCKKHGVSIWGTFAIFTGFFVSAPILFAINRGNYLLLALMFSAIFIVYYKDERRWVRELSYVALAIAAGIKFYPAAFALLLLKEKRFVNFGQVALYSIFLVIFPFFAFKGGFVANVKSFCENLFSWTGDQPPVDASNLTNTHSYDVSMKNLFVMFCCKVTGKSPWALNSGVPNAGLAFGMLVAVAMAIATLFSNSYWRRLSAIGLIITLFPSVSGFYSVAFMLIPFTAFLLNEDTDKKKLVYLIFYLILLCPFSIGYFIKPKMCGLQYGYTLMNWLQGLSMIAMAIMLFVEGVIEFVKDRKAKKANNSVKTRESLQQ